MIKAVIFDLWDTLGSKGFSISKAFQQHFKIKDYSGYLQDYEASIQLNKWGSKKEMALNFLKTFNLPQTEANIDFVINTYDKGIKEARLFEGIPQILASLKQKYLLALVSNTTIFEIGFIDKMDIRKFFNVVLCSHDAGKLKPSKELFEEIASSLSVNLTECLFIDNSETNISAAQKWGIKTIKFVNVDKLKRDLADL